MPLNPPSEYHTIEAPYCGCPSRLPALDGDHGYCCSTDDPDDETRVCEDFPRLSLNGRDVTYVNDGSTSTYWQSPTGLTGVNVSVDLQAVHVRHVPERAVSLSTKGGRSHTWVHSTPHPFCTL